jgi:hypothetical protein
MLNFCSDWERKLTAPELRQQFEEKLTSMPDAESFYLLTTFANMAMARSDPEDRSFIRAATLDLFQVSKLPVSLLILRLPHWFNVDVAVHYLLFVKVKNSRLFRRSLGWG